MDADPPPELRPPVRRAVERLLRDPRVPPPAAAAPVFDAYASFDREGSHGFLVEAAVFVCGEYGTVPLPCCSLDEILTDCVAVAFGFGALMRAAWFPMTLGPALQVRT